jgi:hypothetical protein
MRSNKEMQLTKPVQIAASQLISSVRPTARWRGRRNILPAYGPE